MSSFDYKIGKRSYKYDLSQLSDEEKKKFIGLTRPQKMKYIKEHGGHQKNEVKAGQAIPTEPPIGFAPTKPLYTLPSVSIDDNKTIDDSNDSDKQHDLIDLMYIRNNADKIINGEDTKYKKEDIGAFLTKDKFDDDKWTKAYNARYNALPKKKQQLVKDKDFVDAVKNASPMDLDAIKELFDDVKGKIEEVNRGRTIIDMLRTNEYAVPLNMKIGELQHILLPVVKPSEKKGVAKIDEGLVKLYKYITSYSGEDENEIKNMTIEGYTRHLLDKGGLRGDALSYAQVFAEANRLIGNTAMVNGLAEATELNEFHQNAIKSGRELVNVMGSMKEKMPYANSDDGEEEKKEKKAVKPPKSGDLLSPQQWWLQNYGNRNNKSSKGRGKGIPWTPHQVDEYKLYLTQTANLENEQKQDLLQLKAQLPFKQFPKEAHKYVKAFLQQRQGKGFPKKQLQGKSRALQLISKTGSKMPSKKQLHKCLNKKEIKELYGLMQGGSVSKTVQSSPHWSIKIKGGSMELTQYNNNTLSLSSPSELSEYNTSAAALANSASTNAVIPAGATWKSVSDDMMALASLATGTKPAEVVEQLNKMNRVRAEIAHRDYVNKFVPASLRSKTIQRIPLKAAMIATDAIKKKEITDKVINDIRGYPGLSKQQSDALRSLLKMKGNRVKQFKKILGIN